MPPPNRAIHRVERYALITGHILYGLIAGIIVLVTNSLLAILDNVRELLGSLEEVPYSINDQIDARNQMFHRASRNRDAQPVAEPHEEAPQSGTAKEEPKQDE